MKLECQRGLIHEGVLYQAGDPIDVDKDAAERLTAKGYLNKPGTFKQPKPAAPEGEDGSVGHDPGETGGKSEGGGGE